MTRRLLASYLSLTAFVLLILAIPLGITFARHERRTLTAEVERDAFVLGSYAEDVLEGKTEADLMRLVQAYADRTETRVVIVDADGLSVADSDPPAPGERDFSTRPEMRRALRGEVATGTRHSSTLGTDLLYVAAPIASGGKVHGAIRITYPTTAVDARIRRNWLTLGSVALVVLMAAAVVGWRFARVVSRPLRSLETAATSLAGGDLSARAGVGGPPEVTSLAHTFNEMAWRLDELVTAQRAFVSDASHQLRTPLTALRLRLEGLEDAAEGDLREEAEAASREAFRLQRIVEGLLALARVEGARPERVRVDVARAVEGRREAWEPLAAEKRIHLTVAVESCAAWEVPGCVEQALDNLLANALEAAPPDSEVEITARRDREKVEIHVRDQGPGLNEADREHAFDRFWRGPGGDEGGSGLGLAIVRQLARMSEGDASLRENPGGGIDALILLEAA